MPTLEMPLAESLAETAHWGDDAPIRIEDQEFDLLAFELWHLGSYYPQFEVEDEDETFTVASRASCL